MSVRRLLLATLLASACTAPSEVRLPAGLIAAEAAIGDVVEVWVCRVPTDSTAPIFGGLPLRFDLDPARLAALVGADLTRYFSTASANRYTLDVRAGGEVGLDSTDTHERCVDDAIIGAAASTTAVLVVADAEHAPGFPGGYGEAGIDCPRPCPVATSRRWAYVGGSDFSPQWGGRPPLDLVQHELGHVIGWVHSAVSPHGGYLGALDVMSDSAAPRVVEPSRRDAPGPIGIHRLMAGWLDGDLVTVVRPGAVVDLVAVVGSSTAPVAGTELLVVVLDTRTLVTVEVIGDALLWSHLPAPGIAVHVVRLTADGSPATIDPVTASGAAPFVDLLGVGETLRVLGHSITVVAVDEGRWTVRVA